MGARRIVAFASTALAVVAACATFEEGNDVAGNDDGSDSGSDGTVQGDGPAIDDATSADGGASDAWVPCSMRGIADGAYLCDDFERLGLIEARWTGVLAGNGGTAAFFDGGLASPKSFRSYLPAGDTDTRATLYKDIAPVPPSRVRLKFAARLDALPHAVDAGNAGYAHVGAFQLLPPAPCITSGTSDSRAIELTLFPPNEVRLLTKGLDPCIDGGALPFSSNLLEISSGDLTGQFRQFEMEISRVACAGAPEPFSVRVAIDGMSIPFCHGFTVDVFAVSTTVQAFVGAANGGGSFRETSYVYDNVTIDGE